jgi:GNAT superfamily N-acetyltransferase
MEQLQSVTVSGAAAISNFTAPQWQEDSIMMDSVSKCWVVQVASVGPDVVGFLAFHCDKLEQLFVSPGMQGKGVGKFLLDFAKIARPNGFHLTTAAESGAVRFYEREGLMRGETTAHARFGHPIVRYDWRP